MTLTSRRADSTILLIDDNPSHTRDLEAALVATGAGPSHFEWRRTLAGGLERLAERRTWAIFVNLSLPDSHGLAILQSLLPAAAGIPVVVIGTAEDDELCRTALSCGARDYLLEGHLDGYAFSRAIRNIEEREVARHELFIEQERAQVTLNSIGDAVLSTDVAGNVTYLNVVAEGMTGWSCAEAIGRPLVEVFRVIDRVTRKPARNPVALAIQLDQAVGLSADCILVRRDGHETTIEDSATPIHDRNGQITGAVIVFHDVSMARAMVLEMSHLAQHDVLTDLPNRFLLKERVTQALLLARRNHGHLAVLFVDVDGFKRINDSFGHAVGDQLLHSVAARLKTCVRKSDTVSRQGGDEFVILLPAIAHAVDAAFSADKIIAAVRQPHIIGRHQLRVTVSIGVSTYPDSGDDAEVLIKNADTAMYCAKEQGRDNYLFFDQAMTLRAAERQSLAGQLRCAVEEHKLLLHYQPKVNLKTGVITSVEAVVRWPHPQRGLLAPGEFLTVAEDCGMIVAMGRWVLYEACRQTQEWLDAGLPAVPVSVNVSFMEVCSDQFLDGVRMALQKTSLDPRYLELELTETVLMRNAESTAGALDGLRSMGVRLAIDDFGTGHSSLSYLTRFPVDSLKLDRSFLQNVNANSDAIVVSAVIAMAKSLKHRIIAEGVETVEQLAFLRTHQCEEGQGSYFSQPVTAQQFATLLETGIPAALQH